MIQANELRIGNWIKHDPSYVENQNFIVSDIRTHREKTVNGIEIDDCSPIPLTEKILLKCGAQMQIDKNRFILSGYDIYFFTDKIVFNPNSSTISVVLKSVHQLQNLYFALTAKELEFKL
jgi:hypothetical protein